MADRTVSDKIIAEILTDYLRAQKYENVTKMLKYYLIILETNTINEDKKDILEIMKVNLLTAIAGKKNKNIKSFLDLLEEKAEDNIGKIDILQSAAGMIDDEDILSYEENQGERERLNKIQSALKELIEITRFWIFGIFWKKKPRRIS